MHPLVNFTDICAPTPLSRAASFSSEAMSAPSWALALPSASASASAAPPARPPQRQKKRESGKRARKDEMPTSGDEIDMLGEDVAGLTLRNATTLRQLAGASEATVLLPTDSALNSTTTKYYETVKGNPGHGLGPPHLSRAAALFRILLATDPAEDGEPMELLRQWHDGTFIKAEAHEAALLCRRLECIAAYDEGTHKIHFHFEAQVMRPPSDIISINIVLLRILASQPSAAPKIGAPPPGPAERRLRAAMRDLLQGRRRR